MLLYETIRLEGHVTAELWTPEGELRQRVETSNIITAVGQALYAKGYASLQSGTGVSTPAPVTGMQLGTSTTAAARTGTGSAIVAYISGSNADLTPGWPVHETVGTQDTIRWKAVWEAGEATSSAIREVAMVTTSGNPDSAASSADTFARAVLTTAIDKWATDTLTIVWLHKFLTS